MTSTMLRRCLTAAVAIAALAAVVALAPVSSAEAAPVVSSFEGTYDWNSADGSSWAVTISDNGQITGSLVSGSYLTGSIKGKVSADGSYFFWMSVTTHDSFPRPGPGGGGAKIVKLHFPFHGNLAWDADGNIVSTPDAGGNQSFVWIRQ
ncbi:MAG TPA: hypothetical protein VK661_04105 [Planctomycetota bacterium]|nr:hypothetical protein [Planctomycetota bacterium]